MSADLDPLDARDAIEILGRRLDAHGVTPIFDGKGALVGEHFVSRCFEMQPAKPIHIHVNVSSGDTDLLKMRAMEAVAGRIKLIHTLDTLKQLATFYLDRVQPKMKMEPVIELSSGRYFDFVDPDSTPLHIEDIAHGLSHQCRFTGHIAVSDEDAIYTVAQHSVLASLNCPKDPLGALMHDGAESVIGDVSSPLKQLLPDYKVVEERVERSLARQYGLVYPMTDVIKEVDLRMLATEKRDIMPGGTAEDDEAWRWLPPPFEHFTITPWTPREAKHAFLARWAELTDQDHAEA